MELALNLGFRAAFSEQTVVSQEEVTRAQPTPVCHSAFTQHVGMARKLQWTKLRDSILIPGYNSIPKRGITRQLPSYLLL